MANLTDGEKAAFTAVYKLAVKWHDIRMVREQWDACAEDALKICQDAEAAGCQRLACGLALAVYEWLEEQAKQREGIATS